MPSTPEAVLALFSQTGAYLKGHFQLTSGLHSSEYLQCAKVLQYPQHAERLGRYLAMECRQFFPDGNLDVVVAPAMGGMIIGHEVARSLGVRFNFTERDPATKRMTLRRGFHVEPGERALVIEDVITTGGSSREVIDLMRDSGVVVVGAGSIIDRSGGRVDLSVYRTALATMNVISYDQEQCPLCARGVPVMKPGSRPAA